MPAAAGLLRLLGGVAAPRQESATNSSAGSAAALADQPDFSALLEKARAGELHSGRQITIASRADVKLSGEQLQRLAAAADLAEGQGATRALVLIDGQALRLDVSMREVTEEVNLAKPGILAGIDAVVTVPAAISEAAGPAILPPPGGGSAWSNASLISALAGKGDKTGKEAR